MAKIDELLKVGDIDKECVVLIEAINGISGIRTISSCCGHGKTDYCVWFVAENLAALPDLLYWFDGCHCGFYHWRVIVTTDCAKNPVHFCIEGPVGAYEEANNIAALIAKETER